MGQRIGTGSAKVFHEIWFIGRTGLGLQWGLLIWIAPLGPGKFRQPPGRTVSGKSGMGWMRMWCGGDGVVLAIKS